MEGDASDVDAELSRYAALLAEHKPVACVLGIGENGHLAFNDPPADFYTDQDIHIVELDQQCRQQQVNEGHFPTLESVPEQAISLTVPALLKPSHVFSGRTGGAQSRARKGRSGRACHPRLSCIDPPHAGPRQSLSRP